jgi:hypothetical protein
LPPVSGGYVEGNTIVVEEPTLTDPAYKIHGVDFGDIKNKVISHLKHITHRWSTGKRANEQIRKSKSSGST